MFPPRSMFTYKKNTEPLLIIICKSKAELVVSYIPASTEFYPEKCLGPDIFCIFLTGAQTPLWIPSHKLCCGRRSIKWHNSFKKKLCPMLKKKVHPLGRMASGFRNKSFETTKLFSHEHYNQKRILFCLIVLVLCTSSNSR